MGSSRVAGAAAPRTGTLEPTYLADRLGRADASITAHGEHEASVLTGSRPQPCAMRLRHVNVAAMDPPKVAAELFEHGTVGALRAQQDPGRADADGQVILP